MQHSAHLAYDTQKLLAYLSDTLPANVPRSSVDEDALRKKLSSGMTSATSLRSALSSKGVPYPITGKDDDLITVFLLDMEGTFSPLPFSRKVVFPQMMGHMGAFINGNYPGDGKLNPYLKAASAKSEDLKKAVEADKAANHSIGETVAKVRTLLLEHMRQATEAQSSLPYVKQFQADVWADLVEQQGTSAKTQVFEDFVDFVKTRGARSAQDISRVFVYSTGGVKAQETMLRYTQAGDLTPFVAGLIDPSMVGSKLVPTSYHKIRSHISAVTGLRKDAFRVIFCTDSPSEASAADTSGYVDSSILVVRPGNAWVNIDTLLAVGVPHIASFAQLMESTKPVDYDGLVREVRELLEMAPA